MFLIYIIGPFRASNSWDMECNIRKAEEMSLQLWREGFAVVCPHTNTRFFQGAAPVENFLDGDKEILKRCDAALCIDGWKGSVGSICEVNYAKQKGIKCFVDFRELSLYFGLSSGVEPKYFHMAWEELK